MTPHDESAQDPPEIPYDRSRSSAHTPVWGTRSAERTPTPFRENLSRSLSEAAPDDTPHQTRVEKYPEICLEKAEVSPRDPRSPRESLDPESLVYSSPRRGWLCSYVRAPIDTRCRRAQETGPIDQVRLRAGEYPLYSL